MPVVGSVIRANEKLKIGINGFGRIGRLVFRICHARKEEFEYTITPFDFGGDRYLRTGKIIEPEEIAKLKGFNAILLGAVGHPEVKPGVLEKGLLLRLRFDLDQYINLRPVKLYPGVDCPLKDKGPEHINFDVIRENTIF